MIYDRIIHLVFQLGLIMAASHEIGNRKPECRMQKTTEIKLSLNLFIDHGDLCIGLPGGIGK